MGQSREPPEFLRGLQEVEAHRAGTQHSVDAVAQRALYNAMVETMADRESADEGSEGAPEPTSDRRANGRRVESPGERLPHWLPAPAAFAVAAIFVVLLLVLLFVRRS